jgi:hypothetical protein
MTRLPLLAACAVVAVLLGALLLTGGATPAPPDGDGPGPLVGPVVGTDDRAALDAEPVLRGPDAPPTDPGAVLTDPEATVRAYLAAALGTEAGDAGRTHLRAAPYAVPGTGPATVGVLVLDAPPPGQARTATVRGLDLVAADRGDRRRGYRALVETRTGPPGGPFATAAVTRSVVVARQPDGRWLVAADAPENPDLVAGED